MQKSSPSMQYAFIQQSSKTLSARASKSIQVLTHSKQTTFL